VQSIHAIAASDALKLIGNRFRPPKSEVSIQAGRTGPDAERAAYAMIVHAESGFDRSLMRYDRAGDGPKFCGCGR